MLHANRSDTGSWYNQSKKGPFLLSSLLENIVKIIKNCLIDVRKNVIYFLVYSWRRFNKNSSLIHERNSSFSSSLSSSLSLSLSLSLLYYVRLFFSSIRFFMCWAWMQDSSSYTRSRQLVRGSTTVVRLKSSFRQ